MDLSAVSACKKHPIILLPGLPPVDCFSSFPNTDLYPTKELFQALPLQVDEYLMSGKHFLKGDSDVGKKGTCQDSQKVVLHFQAWKELQSLIDSWG